MSVPRDEQMAVIADIRTQMQYSLNTIGAGIGSAGWPGVLQAARCGAGLARTLATACDELADTLARDERT